MAQIQVDVEVVTSDGKVLGRVKRVEGSAFQLNVPRHSDYWLETNIVKSANSQRVELLITEAELTSYRMDRPGDLTAFQQAGEDPQVLNRQANPRA